MSTRPDDTNFAHRTDPRRRLLPALSSCTLVIGLATGCAETRPVTRRPELSLPPPPAVPPAAQEVPLFLNRAPLAARSVPSPVSGPPQNLALITPPPSAFGAEPRIATYAAPTNARGTVAATPRSSTAPAKAPATPATGDSRVSGTATPPPAGPVADDAPTARPSPSGRIEMPLLPNHRPGIPGYNPIEPNLAVGGQPTGEGFRWLKQRGFRAVLNLRAADADAAEEAIVRQLGLEYLSLPVTAETLTKESIEQFNRLADEARHRPLYIHDDNGSRVAALWYLHRVLVDQVPPDKARQEAAAIGLTDSDRSLWSAIEKHTGPVKPGRNR